MIWDETSVLWIITKNTLLLMDQMSRAFGDGFFYFENYFFQVNLDWWIVQISSNTSMISSWIGK